VVHDYKRTRKLIYQAVSITISELAYISITISSTNVIISVVVFLTFRTCDDQLVINKSFLAFLLIFCAEREVPAIFNGKVCLLSVICLGLNSGPCTSYVSTLPLELHQRLFLNFALRQRLFLR
jgi:hypothetical protein